MWAADATWRSAGDGRLRLLPRQRRPTAPGRTRRLVAPMLDDPSIGLTAPVFTGQRPEASAGRAPDLPPQARAGAQPHGSLRTDRAPGCDGARWDVDFAIGACQVFRRAAFDAVGGLDDSAPFGPEDVDFCLRFRAAGWRVVQVADAGCDHPPRRAFKGLASSARAAATPSPSSVTSGAIARDPRTHTKVVA